MTEASEKMRRRPLAIVVCNAIDDVTRAERGINTDSPAASRKVFMMCHALRRAGVRPVVLSLGRGRADGSRGMYSAKVRRINGVLSIFGPFSRRRGVSEMLSLFGLLNALRRLSRYTHRTVIFYNRMPAYLPTLMAAALLGYDRFLDLEDGEVAPAGTLKGGLERLVSWCFDRLCVDGALLACQALERMTAVRPVFPYYGTVVGLTKGTRWRPSGVSCLMSGTLSPETGAPLLLEVIRRLRVWQPDWAAALTFEVTGQGVCFADFERLAREGGAPQVRVHGRISTTDYLEVLGRCEVGLALKPVDGALADTTFPSKVMEFAGSGMLVLTTDISDVRLILGAGARYLSRNDADLLIERLREIVCDPSGAAKCADQGRAAAEEQCGERVTGQRLREFLFRGANWN